MNGHSVKVRLSDDDHERLLAIVEGRDKATVSGLVRVAMRIGLDAIERRPKILDGHELDTRGGVRPGAGPKPRTAKR